MDFDPSGPADADAGIFGLTCTAEEAAIVLVPVPFDATTSYHQGTSMGPAAILAASHQVDLFDLIWGRPYAAGIHLLPGGAAIQALNARARSSAEQARTAPTEAVRAAARRAVDAAGEAVNAYVAEACRTHLAAGKVVGTLGGDHSTPYAAIEAHVRRYPDLSVLHVDAHADLRPSYEGFVFSHASIMHNVLARTPLKRLVQVGVRDLCEEEYAAVQASDGRVVPFYEPQLAAHAMAGRPFAALADDVARALGPQVYVSFDIDGLDPRLCPNTGTPVPGGLSFREAEALLLALRRAGKQVVGFDLNEVAPGPDGDDWDANVGARLLYKLCGVSLATRGEAAHKSAPPTQATS